MGSRDDARRLVDQMADSYNSRDTDAIDAFYQPYVTYWSALDDRCEGIEALRRHIDHLHEVLPNERMRIQTVITDGDMIVVECESTGTNRVGSPYAIEFTEVLELLDGKVASINVYLDPEEISRATS